MVEVSQIQYIKKIIIQIENSFLKLEGGGGQVVMLRAFYSAKFGIDAPDTLNRNY